jgi:hypothetical protein
VAEIMVIEAKVAAVYWRSHRDQGLIERKGGNLPQTWLRFVNRQKGAHFLGSKYAKHPINAMLNYAYMIEAGRLARALAGEISHIDQDCVRDVATDSSKIASASPKFWRSCRRFCLRPRLSRRKGDGNHPWLELIANVVGLSIAKPPYETSPARLSPCQGVSCE